MDTDLKGLFKRGTSEALEILFSVIGGFFSHWFLSEMVDGKKVLKGLDTAKIRDQAPHFAKTHMDEAEFAALKTGLEPALLKSMEGWMSSLGMHQRADVILTVAEMTARVDLAADKIENRRMAREAAFKALEQLASVTDAVVHGNPRSPWVAKDAHAVGFKFMKAAESDYLGAQLSTEASAALVDAIHQIEEVAITVAADTTRIEGELAASRARRAANRQPRRFWQIILGPLARR